VRRAQAISPRRCCRAHQHQEEQPARERGDRADR
jgi:hypothetical protein